VYERTLYEALSTHALNNCNLTRTKSARRTFDFRSVNPADFMTAALLATILVQIAETIHWRRYTTGRENAREALLYISASSIWRIRPGLKRRRLALI